MENRAYITVTTNKDYARGAVVLYESLKRVNSIYPLYVVIPASSQSKDTKDYLLEHNVLTIESEIIDDGVMNLGTSHWKETLFKLQVFQLIQFKKIVFLDTDMIVLNNIDSLMERPNISCVAAGKSLHPEWVDLNSGLMVIEPNKSDYDGLIKSIDKAFVKRQEQNEGFGDQDVIKYYFKDWKAKSECHLPETYNCMLGYAGVMKRRGMIKSIDDINVYHYTGKQKPWRGIKEKIIVMAKAIKRGRSISDIQAFCRYLKILKYVK